MCRNHSPWVGIQVSKLRLQTDLTWDHTLTPAGIDALSARTPRIALRCVPVWVSAADCQNCTTWLSLGMDSNCTRTWRATSQCLASCDRGSWPGTDETRPPSVTIQVVLDNGLGIVHTSALQYLCEYGLRGGSLQSYQPMRE